MFAAKNELLTRPSGSYQISRSLRFRSSASAYLSRTPASNGNLTTWTLSAWVKRGYYANYSWLISAYTGVGGNADGVRIRSDDKIDWIINGSAALVTTQVFRDYSSWYHLQFVWDTTQATNTNRVKIYVNGTQIPSSAFSTATWPAQNTQSQISQNVIHRLGLTATGINAELFDGYLAEVNFIDGQALTPSSFGAFDTNGVWQPAKYTGSYGTNGFYLNFSDNSGATATTIGKDSSGNSNNWTPNNISLTSGTTYDSMIDSPTNYADGGNGRGNYPTLCPLIYSAVSSGYILSNGNLTYTGNDTGSNVPAYSTMITPFTGKWYAEFYISSNGGTLTAYTGIGVCNVSALSQNASVYNSAIGNSTYSYGYLASGNKLYNSTSTAYGATFTTGDTIAVALDLDAGTLTFYKNNVSQGVAFSGISGQFLFGTHAFASNAISPNFGQQPFTYTPPSGFSALNTQNLPTPTIAAGNKYFDATTYTGDGSSNKPVVNSGLFKPDFVWIKSRTTTAEHHVYDVNRGVNNRLVTNATYSEYVDTNQLLSFNTDGFSLGNNTAQNQLNIPFIAWQWKGGNGTSNIAVNAYGSTPSIASTVSANTSAGFSVVTYTGNSTDNTNYTVGHGLGVTPSLIIIKNRDWAASTGAWVVWHKSASTSAGYLNTTDVFDTLDYTYFMNAAPTSSLFSVRSDTAVSVPNRYRTNGGGTYKYVAYCFAPVAGYSAFGSYTGNGSADGPMIFTGFRPRFIMLKRTDAVSDWRIIDTSRNTYNVTNSILYPDLSNAESTDTSFDILSNGFKLRSTGADSNASGATVTYAAFAETPFKYSRAR